MKPLRPYLIRAVYDWLVDNGLTPYLLVDAENEGAIVPRQFVQEGKIILNLRPEAVQGLILGDERVEFEARFSGQPTHVEFPVSAVLAAYSKENGRGMIFDDEEGDMPSPPQPGSKKKVAKPSLKVVK